MIRELIGKTPLYKLDDLASYLGLKATLFAKLERNNPAGSVKDRAAYYMLRDGRDSGKLAPGGTVIEPTSGNTGIALAALGGALGYRVVIVMPESMSEERRKLIAAYGAELVLTPAGEGMKGAIAKANELAQGERGSYVPMQFENPANALAHYETTGPEIWEQCGGALDAFVAGVGTGGTITGAGRYLREQRAEICLAGVEPAASPVLSGGAAGGHKIQGIGAGFVPKLLDVTLLDRVVTITDEEAFEAVELLVRTEGLFMGTSSGAALAAMIKLAREPELRGKRLAAVLPDGGEKYLSQR